MAKKLVLNDWEDEDVNDLALSLIHSHHEDYRQAYSLNRISPFKFNAANDIVISTRQGTNSQHSVFHSYHLSSAIGVFLISNRSFESTSQNSSVNLFSSEDSSRTYLLPKYAKWDYLLLSDDLELVNSINQHLLKKETITSQQIDFQNIKQTERAVLTNYIYENEY